MTKQKRAPIKNKNVVVKTNGTAYFLSFSRRPGAINLQISKKIMGELIIIALINDILKCIHSASAGARNTRLRLGFFVGIKVI
jgi:hypothetical protein